MNLTDIMLFGKSIVGGGNSTQLIYTLSRDFYGIVSQYPIDEAMSAMMGHTMVKLYDDSRFDTSNLNPFIIANRGVGKREVKMFDVSNIETITLTSSGASMRCVVEAVDDENMICHFAYLLKDISVEVDEGVTINLSEGGYLNVDSLQENGDRLFAVFTE